MHTDKRIYSILFYPCGSVFICGEIIREKLDGSYNNYTNAAAAVC